MRAWLREPLVGFTLIAVVLLMVDAWLRPPAEIEVGPGLSDAVARAFEAQHGREPSEAEHEAAMDAWVDDELLYREGLELGLHEGDPVIRRRVIQQVRQLHRAQIGEAPGDEELRSLRDTWPERYTLPERIGFEHLFFGEDEAAAAAAVAQDVPSGGRAFPRGAAEPSTAVQALSRAYGDEFVEGVRTAEGWVVLESRYGWHVVRRTQHEAARLPTVEELRPVLERDWQSDAAERAENAALERLRGTP